MQYAKSRCFWGILWGVSSKEGKVTAASTLIDRVIQQLLAGTVEERNKLSSGVDDEEETLTLFYDLGSLRDASIFEVGSELMYVWQANTSNKSVDVERGFGGSLAASHDAGSIVTVNPRFPRGHVLLALNSELQDLSSPMNGLFQMRTADLSYNGSDRMIDMTDVTSISELYDVRYRYLNDDYPIVRDVRFLRDMPTSDFPSGNVLAFDAGVRAGTVRVLYKSPFGSFPTEDSTTLSAGIGAELEDLLVLGAQIRLMAGREIKRNFNEAQGDTRRSEEVPPGATINSMIGLQRLRRERILAESARLQRQYPTRIRK